MSKFWVTGLLSAAPLANAIFVRSGDHVGWRYCPPAGTIGALTRPPLC